MSHAILATATPIIVICTRNREKARDFYSDVLGLKLIKEDQFAAIFDIGGISLRVSLVKDFIPHDHTILSFAVADLKGNVQALRAKGVAFNIYEGFKQDELGIWKAPDGSMHVAWLKDPDGNVLSVTQFA